MSIDSVLKEFDLSTQSAEYALRWELQRRQAERDPLKAVVRSLFGKQREFVLDDAKFKTADCTRRAGKSHGLVSYLYIGGRVRPGSTQLYLGLTRDSAHSIMWPKIVDFDREFGLGLKLRESKLEAIIPETESPIVLYGVDQEKLANRLRGRAFGTVCVDEAQSFTSNLAYLIDEVIEPACIDYGGQIALTGTPGPVPAGYFFDACHSEMWKHYKWSVLDNPHIPNAKAVLERIRLRRGWTLDNPTYLREYCGVWAYDPDSLVYKFSREKNLGKKPQKPGFEYAMGVDLGYNDAFTIGVIGWHADHPRAWICYREKHTKKLPDFWAERIQEVQKRYDPMQTWVDAGALGKPIVEQMRIRYGLNLTPAEKTEKMSHIAIMNSDFDAGRLEVDPELEDYIEQMMILKKDDTGTKEDPSLPNDLCDCMLYAWRASRHYWYEPPMVKPEYGSDEWARAEEQRMLDDALAQQSKRSDTWLGID